MHLSLLSLDHARNSIVGIVGHAGCGHSNSHCGFIQDDSGGLCATLRILQLATDLDLTIQKVEVTVGQHGEFRVLTASGGIGTASPRRGITPFEAELAQRCVGEQAVCTQSLAMKCFGRTLGQGAMEVPVALQAAIANAALNSFAKSMPNYFIVGDENIDDNFGRLLGCVLNVDGLTVSLLALSNATRGGLGPNEDIEGNVNLAGKKELMEQLRLDELPTILVEGKVCAEPVSSKIDCPTFVTRAYPGDDNFVVSECLVEAANELDFPIVYPRELLARRAGAMRALTYEMGMHIADLGQKLAQAVTSAEKVKIAAEINRYASEELGGVTFMSDDIHELMGGVGSIPGTTGCLSLFISRKELEQVVYPSLTMDDADQFAELILTGVGKVAARIDEALAEYKSATARYSALHDKVFAS